MILVAGGTGRLGTLVVERLAARGVEVRVLTRQARRAVHLHQVATEVVEGDVRNSRDVAAAMANVDVVVSAVQGFAGPGRVTPEAVDHAGNVNLIDAAARSGADIVLVSVVGASPDSPMELFRSKHAAEQHLLASDTNWTIVRATAFVELWAEIMAKPIVLGRGDNPINFVSVADVASVIERVVTDPSHSGEILEVGGPQNVTFNELAAILQNIRGTDTKVRHIPRWLLRTAAPFARKPRAAITMDTTNMTFDGPANAPFRDLPATDIRSALTLEIPAPAPNRR